MAKRRDAGSNKPFDIVLWGASGFVGALIAEYLTENGGDAKWALAGRNREKLDALKAKLGKKAADVPVLVAGTNDLDALVAQTKVVLTTVGPYAKYGSELVAACAKNGTDYVDLAGETPWLQRMIDAHQTEAEESGARIVPCCGFDSIPSDLGVLFLNNEIEKQTGAPATAIKMRVKAMKGGASGGTIASMVNIIEEATRDRAVARLLSNPYALNPKDERKGPPQPGATPVEYDPDAQAWIGPFVMAAINTRVVHRSNALMNYAYGRDFRYDEAMITGTGVLGGAASVALTGGLGAFAAATAFGPTRNLLTRFVLPKAGEGPSAAARESGMFDLLFFGKAKDGRTFKARVTGDRDPGYGSTAKMISQAALCLANDIDSKDVAGGLWTPASAMGTKLIERLRRNAGLTFEILSN
ncbi:MAG: saccharopine dehydrogenase NADP-binding domain-containing protein [Alphaproteobacteria bacterium]|nr:saccharopine dehydrogenase NADP-binding domain-containing protein [Alphaproteobacteria bacterium]